MFNQTIKSVKFTTALPTTFELALVTEKGAAFQYAIISLDDGEYEILLETNFLVLAKERFHELILEHLEHF